MAENRNWEREYGELSVEELERRLREAFFYTDRIDDTVYLELERLQAALEEKRPVELPLTAEEFWERFRVDRAEELEACFAGTAGTGEKGKKRRYRAILRGALIAAAVIVMLAGAALAADSLGLVAWAPKWNGVLGQYELVAGETEGKPIPAALEELGIDEPVYPARLPEGFVLTESHISEKPLVLMEQYAKGDRLFSIMITPIKGFKNTAYQTYGIQPRMYRSDNTVHYVFANEDTIIVMWYTKNYATTISGNVTLEELKVSIDTLYEASEGVNIS